MSLWTIQIDPDFGCWWWTGKLHKSGYGLIGRKFAHIAVWEEARGRILPGLKLDHWCRRRRCVRPEHLEVVTNRENLKRTFAYYRRSLQRCPENHLLSDHGKKTPEDGIICLICSFPNEEHR